jgi:hypothetical protein
MPGTDQEDFAAARRALRISRRFSLLLLLAGPAGSIFLLAAEQVLAFMMFFMLWLPCLLFAGALQMALVCPRCGYPFFRRPGAGLRACWRTGNLFSRACANCDLRL